MRGDGGICCQWGDWSHWTFETELLMRVIEGFVGHLGNPVSEFPLIYHSGLIDKDSCWRRRATLLCITQLRPVLLERRSS